jgi:hypothetical protein
MDSMAGDLTIRTVLDTRAARFLAAAIVVLAVMPFTAPFSTFDAVEIVSEQVLHANAAQTNVVQDMSDVLCPPTAACALMVSIAIQSTALADRTDVLPFRVLVLRI